MTTPTGRGPRIARATALGTLAGALLLGVTLVGSCALLHDEYPSERCESDLDCFRFQGEVCDPETRRCGVPPPTPDAPPPPDARPIPDATVYDAGLDAADGGADAGGDGGIDAPAAMAPSAAIPPRSQG